MAAPVIPDVRNVKLGQGKEIRLTYDMGTMCLSFESSEKPGLYVELNAVTVNKKYLGKSFEVEPGRG